MLHLLVMCLLCFCRLPHYLYNNSKYLYSHTTNEKTIYFVPLYAVEHNVIFMLPVGMSFQQLVESIFLQNVSSDFTTLVSNTVITPH